ncbi:hypothetical protein LMG19146_00718 [Xanthomonas arboricola pv. fragariae]|nr:hypothetical protein XA1311A_33450 [Xanthomonas arboricola]CAE6820350.1 hypothetical protein XA1311A_33450 [Xanthomonas arboricola]SOT96428.1 hypothetical protein LMG19146_00718 [Xanthomonas arboricola pv. fragariae]
MVTHLVNDRVRSKQSVDGVVHPEVNKIGMGNRIDLQPLISQQV